MNKVEEFLRSTETILRHQPHPPIVPAPAARPSGFTYVECGCGQRVIGKDGVMYRHGAPHAHSQLLR